EFSWCAILYQALANTSIRAEDNDLTSLAKMHFYLDRKGNPPKIKLWEFFYGEGGEIRNGAFPILHAQFAILHYSRSPCAVTHAAAGGNGRLGISRRSTGAISLWNSSSVARCCFLVRPSPSAFTCSTSCPSRSWYRSTLSMICCGLPTNAELRSIASSSEWNTGCIPRRRIPASRPSAIGRDVPM